VTDDRHTPTRFKEAATMSVTVLFDAQVKPEAVEQMKATLKAILPETRSYKGCLGIDIFCNLEDGNNLVFHERWESRQHHAKYVAWRTETGVMAKLGAALVAPPRIRYFERVDA
jgi:quinol monooxygenase YgiN